MHSKFFCMYQSVLAMLTKTLNNWNFQYGFIYSSTINLQIQTLVMSDDPQLIAYCVSLGLLGCDYNMCELLF